MCKYSKTTVWVCRTNWAWTVASCSNLSVSWTSSIVVNGSSIPGGSVDSPGTVVMRCCSLSVILDASTICCWSFSTDCAICSMCCCRLATSTLTDVVAGKHTTTSSPTLLVCGTAVICCPGNSYVLEIHTAMKKWSVKICVSNTVTQLAFHLYFISSSVHADNDWESEKEKPQVRHLPQHCSYVRDIVQVSWYCAISEMPALVHQLSSCIDDLAKSYASLRLQLNPTKTEFIWFGSRVNLTRIPQRFRSIQVCGSVIECDVVVRGLSVHLDSELSMKHHVNKIASACFYHIRRLRQIRHYVSREVLKQLVTSLVLSLLDCCNAIIAGLSASTLISLQRAQNADARGPTLARSWLPIQHHNSSERSTLAASQAPHHLQSRNSDAPSSSSSLSTVLGWPRRVQVNRLSSTTPFHYDQSRRDTENSDPVPKTGLYVCGPDVRNSLLPSVSTVDSDSSPAILSKLICSSWLLAIKLFFILPFLPARRSKRRPCYTATSTIEKVLSFGWVAGWLSVTAGIVSKRLDLS